MEGQISKKSLVIWEAAAVLAALAAAWLVDFFLPPRCWLWYLLLWLDGLALVLAAFLYLPLRYENCRYIATDEYVEYQRGFIFLTRSRILRRAVLYVTVVRTPFSVLLRTRTLVIRSMGGSMTIPCLPIKEAEALLKELTPRHPAIRPRLYGEKGGGHD
ncbi:MAG TPA: PH domain-containing protein [Candidatus Merdivicinus intestinavium]|nr:PH domain-containing protein [Candidatus Merdivicinus intestinavium]